jgi:hypothetical protein
MRRKGKPHNPLAEYQRQQAEAEAAKRIDRQASDLVRGAIVSPAVVDDPHEAGAKIVVARSLRDDPLARLHVRKQIDDAQYHGGRAFQRDFSIAERGPQAIDTTKEAVDGGKSPEPITEAQRKAAGRLNRVYRALGHDGSAITHSVLVNGQTGRQIAEARGLSGRRWEEYFGQRFRECLDRLAIEYGFATA